MNSLFVSLQALTVKITGMHLRHIVAYFAPIIIRPHEVKYVSFLKVTLPVKNRTEEYLQLKTEKQCHRYSIQPINYNILKIRYTNVSRHSPDKSIFNNKLFSMKRPHWNDFEATTVEAQTKKSVSVWHRQLLFCSENKWRYWLIGS